MLEIQLVEAAVLVQANIMRAFNSKCASLVWCGLGRDRGKLLSLSQALVSKHDALPRTLNLPTG